MSYAFDGFVLDLNAFKLLRDGREVQLERRAFDLLHYLLQHQERAVSKDELLEQVWHAKALSDGVLSNTVAKLRRALGQRAGDKHPIETVHGRGYRFCLRGSGVGATESAAPESAAPRPEDPFVGRELLLQSLASRLSRPSGGSENIALLRGEAGIGKTRLVRELARTAERQGFSVFVGSAYEGVGAPPYWLWTQVLRAARDELSDEQWARALPRGAWAVRRLLPELSDEPAPRVSEAEPPLVRFQLFEEVSRFLRNVAELRPLLIVLDDLQCADTESLALLAFVAHALEHKPVHFVCTQRTGEPSADAREGQLMQVLGRAVSVLPVLALGRAEVQALAAALLGESEPSPSLSEALYQRTQGNPLFVRQALDLLRHTGERGLSEAQAIALPPAIREVLRRRLEGLTPEARRALSVAAVVGKTFDAPLLAELLGLSVDQLLSVLDPALRIGVIEWRPESLDGFSFAHVLTRDTLYDELPMRERGELHGRTARTLARRSSSSAGLMLAELAHHALLAVPFELSLAVDACLQAAAFAREAASFEAATQVLTRAIHKLDHEPPAAALRYRLLYELGENHFYAGLVGEAYRAFRQAAQTARESGEAALLAQVGPRLADCLELGVGEPWFARSVVDEALQAAHSQQTRAVLLAQRAELSAEGGVKARLALLEEAARLAHESGVPEAILEVAHSRAILRDPTRTRDNARDADQLLVLMEQHAQAAASMRYRSLRRLGAYVTKYLADLTSCDLASADAALDHCRRIADSSHVRAARLVVDLMRAGRALADGRLPELERIVLPQLASSATRASAERDAYFGYFALLLEAQGKLDVMAAIDLDHRLVDQAPSRYATYSAVSRARLFALVGRPERARALLSSVDPSELARMPVQHGDLSAMCALVDLQRMLHASEEAEAMYARLLPYAALNAVGMAFDYHGAVAHWLGVAAGILGRKEAARAHFEQAITINRALHMPAYVTRSERALRELAT